MDSLTPQQRFIQTALHLQKTALPLAQGYMQRQAALGLEQVLSEERLSSADGIAASLAAIDGLEQLVAENRASWQQWMIEATRHLAAALEDFPEAERAETSQSMLASIQVQMEFQHRSMSARAEWIEAARTICRLAQLGRDLAPDAAGPVFASEDDLEEVQRQLARIAAAAAAEQQLLEERAARMRDSMAKLQPR
ncbi:MAG TPA: hypothetical protein VFF16_03585 [Telluria sp.]|nr:hypothetical protein [Telluria sp.]